MNGQKDPFISPEGNFVIWSDIPNNRMLRYEINKQQTFVHREPSNNSNGNYRNIDGKPSFLANIELIE